MPGTGLKVCVRWWVVVCKPIIVFSLVQAEQKSLNHKVSMIKIHLTFLKGHFERFLLMEEPIDKWKIIDFLNRADFQFLELWERVAVKSFSNSKMYIYIREKCTLVITVGRENPIYFMSITLIEHVWLAGNLKLYRKSVCWWMCNAMFYKI